MMMMVTPFQTNHPELTIKSKCRDERGWTERDRQCGIGDGNTEVEFCLLVDKICDMSKVDVNVEDTIYSLAFRRHLNKSNLNLSFAFYMMRKLKIFMDER